jgi:hypothetical protein
MFLSTVVRAFSRTGFQREFHFYMYDVGCRDMDRRKEDEDEEWTWAREGSLLYSWIEIRKVEIEVS